MIKFRRVKAIMKKQIKDTFKNKTILLQFILFPLTAVLFTEFVAKNQMSANGIVVPIGMILGFLPMLEKFLIIGGNILVLLVTFTYSYKNGKLT